MAVELVGAVGSGRSNVASKAICSLKMNIFTEVSLKGAQKRPHI